ncbi:MAG: mechanosensitive ion channel domain-containing protein [Cyanobacteria bacterium P01_A01_bin.114]
MLSSAPARSQLAPIEARGNAEIVVDGRVVFEIYGTDKLTATARARSINAQLKQEVRRSEQAVIEPVKTSGNLFYLRSQHSDASLVTITQADAVTPEYQPEQQATLWAKQLQLALRQGQLERSPSYLRQATLYSLIVLAAAIALHLILRSVGRLGTVYLNRQLGYTTHPFTEWERPIKLFWQLALSGLKVGLWLIVAFYVTDIFPQARSWRYTLYNFLTAEVISLGNAQYSALELLLLIGLTVGLWFVTRAIAQFFRLYVLSRARLEPRIQDILSVLIQYVLVFLGAIVLLQTWGIDSSTLAILASLLGVGIGFGVQNITNNFISGFIITLERPIQVGDFINIGELVGIVKRVGARSTEIYTLDHVTIIVPNSRFLESEVINWSHGNPVSRLRVPVSVAYGSDIGLVKTALLEAIKRHPEVLLRPEPEVWFQSFGDSALNFEIMVWTGEPRKQFRVRSDLNYAIEASLHHHGIEVPFPQRDLHLRSPQLDELVGLLKQQVNGVSNLPASVPAPKLSPTQKLSPEPSPELLTKQDNFSEGLPDNLSNDVLSNLDLEALAEAMQGEQGLEVQDHAVKEYEVGDNIESSTHYYPDSFTGSAVVAWLMQKRDYTREGAILVGQWLLHKGLICGMMEQTTFEDDAAYYQFYQDSSADLEFEIEKEKTSKPDRVISERASLDKDKNVNQTAIETEAIENTTEIDLP